VIRLLKKLLAVASTLMVIYGLALIGYGILYWLVGFPYPLAALLAFSAYGSFLSGAGLFLRLPETTLTLTLSTASFCLSAALMTILNLSTVWPTGAIVFVVVSGVGALASYARLLLRKHRTR
jgi:hypothetical protein